MDRCPEVLPGRPSWKQPHLVRLRPPPSSRQSWRWPHLVELRDPRSHHGTRVTLSRVHTEHDLKGRGGTRSARHVRGDAPAKSPPTESQKHAQGIVVTCSCLGTNSISAQEPRPRGRSSQHLSPSLRNPTRMGEAAALQAPYLAGPGEQPALCPPSWGWEPWEMSVS